MIEEENGDFVSDNGGFGRGRGGEDKGCARDVRENWKFLKTIWDLTLFV